MTLAVYIPCSGHESIPINPIDVPPQKKTIPVRVLAVNGDRILIIPSPVEGISLAQWHAI